MSTGIAPTSATRTDRPTHPRPSTRAWLVWSFGVLAYILAIVSRSSLSAVAAETSDRFGVTAATLSTFAVLQLGVYGAMQIPVGLILDRIGPRRVLTVGLLVMALGQGLLAVTESVPGAFAARFLVGAGDATIFVSVVRLIIAWFPPRQAPLLTQVTGLIAQFGQIVSVIPLLALVHSRGWTFAFLGLALVLLLVAIAVGASVRDHPPHHEAPVLPAGPRVVQRVREVWSNPGTRLGFWAHFVTPHGGNVIALLWGFPYLTAGEGLPIGQAQALLSIQVVAGAVFGLLIGRFAGRHPLRRSWAVLAVVGIQAVALAVVVANPGPAPVWQLLILVMCFAAGGPGSLVGLDFARTSNPPHLTSSATGMANSAGFLASLLALLMIGALLDVQNAGTPDTYSLEGFRIAFCSLYLLWLVGVVGVLHNRRRLRRVMAENGVHVPPLREVVNRYQRRR
ncbi:MFS transporter [Kineosporia sp. NBRC 101677]|uniref:MFS transporter n=1 Tax=Kineosporia sp. NBRC 101677 TaxID=3032197 RepID=UPI0024A51E11|nr:MFS transporter [Kineosporia sp. NBRC 101677]GLY16296.1 MFS transporter [Kineosporia sp. NBRC 101677]